jgi:hypothetical protein
MIKKEYIQPTVKEIKINLPVVLASGSNDDPTWSPNDEDDQEEDLG